MLELCSELRPSMPPRVPMLELKSLRATKVINSSAKVANVRAVLAAKVVKARAVLATKVVDA